MKNVAAVGIVHILVGFFLQLITTARTLRHEAALYKTERKFLCNMRNFQDTWFMHYNLFLKAMSANEVFPLAQAAI